MRANVWIGILLIVGGVFLYLRGYTTKREVVDVGPLSVSTEERQSVPAWIAGLAIGAGVLLVVSGTRKRV
jgi:hypothetical protein